jgi:hypothetical protein
VKLYLHSTHIYRTFIEKFVVPVAEQEFEIVHYRHEDNPSENTLDLRKRVVTEALQGDEPFLFSGCDILYHKPCKDRLLELLGDSDMAAHNDSLGGACTDFFIMRPNETTRKFWKYICETAKWETFCEQGACNRALAKKYANIKFKLLPMDEFFTTCACLNGGTRAGWLPLEKDIPKTARIVHAACVYYGEKWDVLMKVQEHLSRLE